MNEEKGCKSCGETGWKPGTSRREFIQGAVTAGAGLALAGVMLGGAQQAQAQTGGSPKTFLTCEVIHEGCLRSCGSRPNAWERTKCRTGCEAEWIVCLAREAAGRLGDALRGARNWLNDHPGVQVGTIVVLVGIAFIVTGGGAALGIAFA